MKKIAIISLISAGTMGHMSLTTRIAKCLSKNKNEVYLFSEKSYSDCSNIKNSKIYFIEIPKQKNVKSVGGNLYYEYQSQLINKLVKNKIEMVLFSTFYDENILKFCNKNGIKTILISYPLRDSHRKAIALRGYYNLFDKVYTLKDLIEIHTINNCEEIVLPPVIQTLSNNNIKKKNILITCGGGGRPSSKLFLNIARMIIKKLDRKNIKFTVITGHNKFKIKEDNCKTIRWSNDFLKLISNNYLVISEAGYFTINELLCLRKPGIIIPGERRIDNQELRSLKYEEMGCGFAFFPIENPNQIMKKLEYLLDNPKEIEKMINGSLETKRRISQGYVQIESALLNYINSH